jgi:hypothetical protein
MFAPDRARNNVFLKFYLDVFHGPNTSCLNTSCNTAGCHGGESIAFLFGRHEATTNNNNNKQQLAIRLLLVAS